MASASPVHRQVVSGLVPPELGEARIRTVWPSVTVYSAPARLGETLMRSIVLAPLGWFLLLPVYFLKILPGVGRRYTLTNRRLMIQRGLAAKPSHEIELSKIDDVRIQEGSHNAFFRSATLEVLSGGQVAMTLPGVPGADAFRHAILSASRAWAPRKS